jgi:hypothetical protein
MFMRTALKKYGSKGESYDDMETRRRTHTTPIILQKKQQLTMMFEGNLKILEEKYGSRL